MKRYFARIMISDTEEWEGDVIRAEEVDTELAKDKEEYRIAEMARRQLLIEMQIKDEMIAKNKEEIARLASALDDCCRMFDWCERRYGQLARETLAEKE